MTTHIVVAKPAEYIDRTLATASWWDRYELIPGEYPLTETDISYHAYRPATGRPYYAIAKVAARLVESYRVNRLFSHSHAELRDRDEEATVHVRLYAYEVHNGRTVLDGGGVVTGAAD